MAAYPSQCPPISAVRCRPLPPCLPDLGITLQPWQETDAAAVTARADPEVIQRWRRRSGPPDQAGELILHWCRGWQEKTGASRAVTGDDGAAPGRVALLDLSLTYGHSEIAY